MRQTLWTLGIILAAGIPCAMALAIGGGADDHLRTDVTAGARPVLDDKRLAEPIRQALTDQTGDNVG